MGQESWTQKEGGVPWQGALKWDLGGSVGRRAPVPVPIPSSPPEQLRRVGAVTTSPPVDPEHVVQHFIKQDQGDVQLFFVEDFQPRFDVISQLFLVYGDVIL